VAVACDDDILFVIIRSTGPYIPLATTTLTVGQRPGMARAHASSSSHPSYGSISEQQDAQVGLHRGLSARQVQMIAIAGTIGTGLFLGTGRSLAQGGPASMLICYSIVGFIVYVTLLLLGEMATQYPVAGSFNAYTTRFFSPSYGFALAWNYWFNDAVSVASDLTAAQLVLQYWTPWSPWVISLLFWLFLVTVNAAHVKAYGELGTQALRV
jgi:AAT family amino acid transporter